MYLIPGFNPCYDGFVFLTLITQPLLFPLQSVSILVMMDLSFWQFTLQCSNAGHKFQSLLWWICLFDPLSAYGSSFPIAVSILVMMDLSFWHHQLPIFLLDHIGFNPCYDGFVFLTWRYISVRCFSGSVSILVMMDLSFWHSMSQYVDAAGDSFNPCYDGFVFLTPEKLSNLLLYA